MASDLIPMSEVRKHNSAEDLWVVIYNRVYNLTSFLDDHPAGRKVRLECACLPACLPACLCCRRHLFARVPRTDLTSHSLHSPKVILDQAGKDATLMFDPFHSSDIIERLGLEEELFVGMVDPATVLDSDKSAAPAAEEPKPGSPRPPPLSQSCTHLGEPPHSARRGGRRVGEAPD